REAEPERQQVDDRFEQAREGRPAPVGLEVRVLAAHHAAERRWFEPAQPDPPPFHSHAHSASSPVRRTKTSSSEAARRTASSGTPPSAARSLPTIAIAGPAGRTLSPAASALALASARRSGGA